MKITTETAKKLGEKIGIDWSTAKYTVEDFKNGLQVEKEHGLKNPKTNVTNDNAVMTGKIARAHLEEFPQYYVYLKQMEDKLKKLNNEK